MERVCPKDLPAAVTALPAGAALLKRLAETARDDMGAAPVYLVGGAVRDLLLGRVPRELDLCVEGEVQELAARLGGAHRVHGRFDTCTVEFDGARYDIARARSETYASPGALPDVAPAGIDRDLERRDFTVNAMALALTGPAAGELRTAPCALPDLAAGRLRVLHAASFRDDPTRLLRMVRYATRLGLDPEDETARLARAAVAGGALSTISSTRIGNELRLLAREEDPVRALIGLRELGLEAAIAPGFGLDDPGLAERALALLPGDGRRDLLVLAVAWRGVPRPARAPRLTELGFTAGERDTVAAAADQAEPLSRRLLEAAATSPRGAAIATAVNGNGAEAVALAGAFGAQEPACEWLERLRHVRLEITGADLIETGIAPGPALGAGLRAALAAKRDGRVSGREAELEVARRAAGGAPDAER